MNIPQLINKLLSTRLPHFALISGVGLAINLSFVTLFTELVFGRERYFSAYIIGLVANLLFNFIFHTIYTFKTKQRHTRRFIFFIVYNLVMSYIQARIIDWIVPIIGYDWYLFIIISIICFFAVFSFILYKFGLFKD